MHQGQQLRREWGTERAPSQPPYSFYASAALGVLFVTPLCPCSIPHPNAHHFSIRVGQGSHLLLDGNLAALALPPPNPVAVSPVVDLFILNATSSVSFNVGPSLIEPPTLGEGHHNGIGQRESPAPREGPVLRPPLAFPVPTPTTLPLQRAIFIQALKQHLRMCLDDIHLRG